MKINRLCVTGLFGLYDYAIDFSHEGVDFTVITSPNGYGKTTLLRIVNSLHIQRLFFLFQLKFLKILFLFDDGSELVVSEPKQGGFSEGFEDKQTNERKGMLFKWNDRNRNEICRFDYKTSTIRSIVPIVASRISDRWHYHLDLSDNNWEFFTKGEAGEELNSELARMQKQEQFFLQLATVQTDFIGANRIYSLGRNDRPYRFRNELPIHQIVNELQDRLSKAVNGFQNNFQSLDSKFIDTILEDKMSEISEEEYDSLSTNINDKIEQLSSLGLTNKQVIPIYRKSSSKILGAYLNLMKEKLQYYDEELLPLLQLFNKNIQQKHFANKVIRISPQHGLRIESDNGDILDASVLSTGEQNQLVLLYDLIFKTPKNSILLIDEPESSLHVAWQNDFVKDMVTIAMNKGLQIIVATHSPIIVSHTEDSRVFDLYYLQKRGDA